MFGTYLWFANQDAYQALQISDSVEYTLASHALMSGKGYLLELAGKSYPPRYAPWFSGFFLSPLFGMFGLQAGIEHAWMLIGFYSIVSVLAAYIVGLSVGSGFGGALAAGIVILLPGFRYYSSQIMTEIPSTALLLLLFACYQALKKIRKGATKLWLLIGVLLMLSVLLKPLMLGFVCPFLFMLVAFMRHEVISFQIGLRNIIFLLVPPGFALALQAIYNQNVFGSFFRSGYHFWVSIPYDYPGLLLSFKYLLPNVQVLLLGTSLVVLCALIFVIPSKRDKATERRAEEIRSGLTFIFLGIAPLLLFHLLYFYQSDRFFLGFEVLVAAFAGGMLGRLVPTERVKIGTVCSVCLFVAGSLFATLFYKAPVTGMTASLGFLKILPDRAILVSDGNPLLLEQLSPRVNLIPWSRETEYASKLAMPQKALLDPAPDDAFAHRDTRLLDLGACEVYQNIAKDSLDFLQDRIEEQKPVFVLDTGREKSLLPTLKAAFDFEQVGANLYQLKSLPEDL